MVIFHSYASLSEGIPSYTLWWCNQTLLDMLENPPLIRHLPTFYWGFCRFSPSPGAIFASAKAGRSEPAEPAEPAPAPCFRVSNVQLQGPSPGQDGHSDVGDGDALWGEDISGCLSAINWEMYGFLSHKKAVVFNLMISNDIYGCLTNDDGIFKMILFGWTMGCLTNDHGILFPFVWFC